VSRDPRSVLRKEDRPLLTGAACFAADLRLPGTAHAAVVRSPVAHALVRGICADEALERPGVLAVLTAADVPHTVRIPIRQFSLPGMDRFLQPPLAREGVRYMGEPVAVVVATDRYRAEDGAELVRVEYEELDAVLEPARALADGAPLLFADAGTNVAGDLLVEYGDVDGAFRAAELIVEETIRCHRHGAVPMETRGLVAEPRADGGLTVWGAAKVPHVNRRILCGLLGWPEDRVRFVELHVGGGFGARGEFYPEDYLIPLCAILLGRPVSWIEDRAEHLASTNHSREQVHQIAVALTADGRLLAIRDSILSNCGAYVRTHGMTVPGMSAALLHGPYRWPAYRCQVQHVLTNKTPSGTYRAPGRYEANLARERAIDIAAHRLRLDPVEVRRRNLVPPALMPYDTGTHTEGHPVVLDSGDYPGLLARAEEALDLQALRRWRAEGAGLGRRRGVGVACFVEKAGIGVREYARVAIDRCGRVTVASGVASVGQGVETVLAQVCAQHLGVSYEDVTVVHGDTDVVPEGMGAFGSRASMLGGSAVMRAATALRRRLIRAAAAVLEAAPEDLEICADTVRVKGSPESAVHLDQLGASHGGLSEEARFASEDMSFPCGIHIAGVEVDVDTGGVSVERYGVAYDVGRALNPMLVEGQIAGGVAQGIGGALLEEFVYDQSGQLVTGSLMDYLVPTAHEVPDIQTLIVEDTPTRLNPLGVKGAGEAGVSAAGAAIANALSDALGTEVLELPLTPERVRALAGAGALE
jgi:CO/xanthine dehydrogenase Mo-binding subunit